LLVEVLLYPARDGRQLLCKGEVQLVPGLLKARHLEVHNISLNDLLDALKLNGLVWLILGLGYLLDFLEKGQFGLFNILLYLLAVFPFGLHLQLVQLHRLFIVSVTQLFLLVFFLIVATAVRLLQ
jgi:hypothetical protein